MSGRLPITELGVAAFLRRFRQRELDLALVAEALIREIDARAEIEQRLDELDAAIWRILRERVAAR